MNQFSRLKIDNGDTALQESVARKASAAIDLLRQAVTEFAPVALANSLSAEDMVLTDLICQAGLDIENFSLDTGRLPPETYDLMARLRTHYDLPLVVYYPRHEAVENYVRHHGVNAFYDSVELRRACCQARKVEPLQRALTGKRAWITGMRAQQSATRDGLPVQTFDEVLILTDIPAEPFDVLIIHAGLAASAGGALAFEQPHPQLRHVLVYDDQDLGPPASQGPFVLVRLPGPPDSVTLELFMDIIDPPSPATGLRVLPWLRELARSPAV